MIGLKSITNQLKKMDSNSLKLLAEKLAGLTMLNTKINWIGTFDRIKNEDDLKPKPGININPPPEDGRCDCCGRHISELNPFGGPGDPLVGDFTGSLLVKKYRALGPYDAEAQKVFEKAQRRYEADGFDDPLDWMIDQYGREKAEAIDCIVQMYRSTRSSWECKDCMCLDMDEYFEKLEHSNK